MNHALEPDQQFTFVTPSQSTYTLACYWQNLYTFTYGQERILVAERVVPHTNLYESLYHAFKGHQGDTLSHRLIPETTQTPLLNVVKEGQSLQPFIESVTALIPLKDQTLPKEWLQKTETILEETATQTLIERGITGGLGSFDTSDTTSFLSDNASPNDVLSTLSHTEREDVLLINLSIQVDAALKKQMRTIMKDDALQLYDDPEFDLSTRLYNNPKYLAFVRRVLKAKGSYVSPVVRDFLSFYSRCLNIKLHTHARETHTDIDTIKKRLESTLGHEKGGTHHAFDYHELTILGYVVSGNLQPDPQDPDQTDYSFKLDSNQDIQKIHLREITENRFLIQKFVHHTFNTHHNVRNVNYIDETLTPKSTPLSVLPDPIEKAIQKKIEQFDEWLGTNNTRIISAGIGWLIFALVLTLGVVVLGLFRASGSW
ncbi:MAG: hypothetical protein ACO36I_10655 [Candidatus Latescibacterota bacterium]